MAGRGRGALGGDGYEPYDYTYDYGNDSADSYNFESWMTSCPMPSNGGAKHMGPGRDSYGPYNRKNRGRYGFSKPERGYGNRRAQHHPHPSQSGWRGDARGRLRGNFRPPRAARGLGRPMPLLNQGTFQDPVGFQGLRAFTSNSYFGGGFKPKFRKPWKDKKKLGAEGEGGPAEKKMKMSTEDDGTKSEESELEGDGEAEEAGTSTKTEGDDKQEEAEESDKEEKQIATKKQQEIQNRRLRDRMVEMIQFVCSLCKFRTFYSEEMTSHMQSEFHKEHFHYVGEKLPKQSADFLQEYVSYKTKRTEERRNVVEDLSSTILQIHRDHDLTQDLGVENFVKRVEAAHCSACDMFIPMNFTALRRHVRSPMHNQNRRSMMENSKKAALAISRSILNNKLISQKLERYIKGQNPFVEQSEVSGDDSTAQETSEGLEMVAIEGGSCENQDLPACDSSTTGPDVSSEDVSDRMVTEDCEMLTPGTQEECTDNEIIGDSLHEQEGSEDSETKY